jgi:hypothetical protein
MAAKYEDLVDVKGTVYSKAGKGYQTEEQLAADLGIAPHGIDWSKIAKSSTIPGQTSYEDLSKVGETIYKGEKGYATEGELAADLGIAPHEIDWNRITSEDIAPVDDIDLSQVGGSYVDESENTMAWIQAQMEESEKRAKLREEEKGETETEITTLLKELEGQGAEQLQMEQEAGIPGMRTEYADIGGQLQVKTAEYNKLKAQRDAAIEAVGETSGFITSTEVSGRQAAIERQFNSRLNVIASEATLLEAQNLALSGRITAAQSSVDRAIDLKYNSKERELDTLKWELGLISEDLNSSEEKLWNYQMLLLDRQEEQIAEQKAEEKEIQAIAIQAVIGGASPDLVTQIQQAGSLIEATQLAQPYLVEKEESTTYAPTSAMKDYQAAGGETGTGMDYNTWYQQIYKGREPAKLSEEEFKSQFIEDYGREHQATPLESTVDRAWQEYSGMGEEEISNYTRTEMNKIEQKLGPDWKTTSTREEQLNVLYNSSEDELDNIINKYIP